jgi:hypothetical protein
MLRRTCTLVLSLSAAVGCANHVRFADEMRERESRVVTSSATHIESREAVIAEPAAALTVSADETVRLRRRETVVHLDEETPWRARNELWEVPTGLVTVPFFVGMRASNKFFFLGMVPESWIGEGIDYGFAALNPALNVEDEDRVVGREVSRRSRDIDEAESRQLRPLAGAPGVLSLAEGPSQTLTCDPSGHVRVELLELLRGVPQQPPQVLHIEVQGDGPRPAATLELPLSRGLRARLVKAAHARQAALAPGVSPDLAARQLALLDDLGFHDSALRAEQELRDRQQANAAWLSRLDLALEVSN